MAQATTGFKPDRNGYLFVNSFPFPFSVTFNLPFAGTVDIGDIVYGLCGGMCFGALDSFYMGQTIPDYRQVDEIPARYLRYLWDRQIDSFGLLVIPKVIEWMLRSDVDIALRTSRYEIPKLRRRLDRGEPTVLALIRAERGDDPTRNHQVLATGYEFDESKRSILIELYDPNHPQKKPSLKFDLTRPSSGISPKQSTGEFLRGFFVIKYRSQQPPTHMVYE